jgi:antitoxin CcdA
MCRSVKVLRHERQLRFFTYRRVLPLQPPHAPGYFVRMTDAHIRYGTKKATNVSITKELLQEAKDLGINLSATLEQALVEKIRDRRRAQWVADNAEAIDAYNEDVRKNGVFSDGRRLF